MFRRVPVAVVAGLALWLSFPPVNLWFLAPAGAGLLALSTAGARAWQGALLGFTAGVAFFWPLLTWIGIYLGPLPVVALVILEALYVALAGWAMAIVQAPGRSPLPAAVGVACAWTAAEWLRAVTPFGGFAWGRLAFGQADAPWAELTGYLGVTGLTWFVALTGALLAAAANAVLTGRLRARLVLAPLAAAGALVLAGSLIPAPAVQPRGTAQLLAIQGNVPRAGLDFNAERRAVTDNHARATTSAAAQVSAGALPRPDLVVWPENSADIDPTRNEDARRVIQAATDAIGVPVIVGAVLREPGENLSNAALLYRPGQGLTGRYIKQRPVPFAEYMPYRDFFRRITPLVDLLARDFAPGQETVVFTVPRAGGDPIRVATPICFEVSIDDVMAATVREGANLLAVPTNNATFGFTGESVQQLAISRIRALELGRSVVHVSTVGVSALITPDGQAHQRSELFTQATLSGALPLHDGLTPAAQLGHWPAAVAVLGFAALAGARWRRRD